LKKFTKCPYPIACGERGIHQGGVFGDGEGGRPGGEEGEKGEKITMMWWQYFQLGFYCVGIAALIFGILNYRRNKKSGEVIRQMKELLIEQNSYVKGLVEKVGASPEDHLDLLPDMGGVIQANVEMETQINSPAWSDVFGKTKEPKESYWSDVLDKDIFVAGQPLKWKDVVKGDLDFHGLVRASIYPNGEDTH
jgi:hypothetical protein